MDGHEAILHRFDTVWFFSSVLSPRAHTDAQPDNANPPQAPETPDACENRAPPEPTRIEAGSIDGTEESPKEHRSEQRSRGRDQRGKQMQRRAAAANKENREAADGGFLHLELLRSAGGESFGTLREKDDRRKLRHRRVAFSSCSCACNMPRAILHSAGDDFAMKEHLRSWAHAVASAVR